MLSAYTDSLSCETLAWQTTMSCRILSHHAVSTLCLAQHALPAKAGPKSDDLQSCSCSVPSFTLLAGPCGQARGI